MRSTQPGAAPSDDDIQAALLSLIRQRGEHSSACPSELARALSSTDWRALMPRVRGVALALRQQGLLDICQGGVSVSHSAGLRGPIRIRLPQIAGDLGIACNPRLPGKPP